MGIVQNVLQRCYTHKITPVSRVSIARTLTRRGIEQLVANEVDSTQTMQMTD